MVDKKKKTEDIPRTWMKNSKGTIYRIPTSQVPMVKAIPNDKAWKELTDKEISAYQDSHKSEPKE